jgi:hypothetical protein
MIRHVASGRGGQIPPSANKVIHRATKYDPRLRYLPLSVDAQAPAELVSLSGQPALRMHSCIFLIPQRVADHQAITS